MSEQELKRMRWASRRGMLELDLMLEPFVNDCYSGLSEVDRGRFRTLMECEDQDLFGWFLQRKAPDDVEMAAIVEKILHHARTRPRVS